MFAQLELALIPIILNTNCVLVLHKLEPFLIDVSVNACLSKPFKRETLPYRTFPMYRTKAC